MSRCGALCAACAETRQARVERVLLAARNIAREDLALNSERGGSLVRLDNSIDVLVVATRAVARLPRCAHPEVTA